MTAHPYKNVLRHWTLNHTAIYLFYWKFRSCQHCWQASSLPASTGAETTCHRHYQSQFRDYRAISIERFVVTLFTEYIYIFSCFDDIHVRYACCVFNNILTFVLFSHDILFNCVTKTYVNQYEIFTDCH